MNSNISDVAKLAGVSPTTVSRVMNNRVGAITALPTYDEVISWNQ